MSKIIRYESKKLHYGKYLYKIYIFNPLAPWFRTEFQKSKLDYIKDILEEYKKQYSSGQTLTKKVYRAEKVISNNEYLDAWDIFEALYSHEDYKIRVEKYDSFTIYSNDKQFLLGLVEKLRCPTLYFWEPREENIDIIKQNNKICIINKELPYRYKVHLKVKRIDSTFSNWLTANTDKSKVGNKTLESIKSGVSNGGYFYIRDEKVLYIVHMLIGQNISKVEELVYINNIDKY